VKQDQAQYTEIGRDGKSQQPYELTGLIDRSAIPGLLATGDVPTGAITPAGQ
jgi:hypothetical protein